FESGRRLQDLQGFLPPVCPSALAGGLRHSAMEIDRYPTSSRACDFRWTSRRAVAVLKSRYDVEASRDLEVLSVERDVVHACNPHPTEPAGQQLHRVKAAVSIHR